MPPNSQLLSLFAGFVYAKAAGDTPALGRPHYYNVPKS